MRRCMLGGLFLAALVVAFLGISSVASADLYPIQNVTTTHVSAGGILTVGGISSNLQTTVQLNGSVASEHVYAGAFLTQARAVDNTTTTADPTSGYQGNVLWLNNQIVRTYCMEITGALQTTGAFGGIVGPYTNSNPVNSAVGITSRIDAVPPAGGLNPQNPTTYVTDSPAAAQRAAWIVAQFGQTNDSTTQAAVQVAVWAVMYQFGLGSGGAGNEKVESTSNSKFYVSNVSNSSVTGLADSILTQSYGLEGQGYIVRQGVHFDGTYNNPNGQDLLYAVTPEPTSLAIAGLGALGFGAHAWRRVRKGKKS